MCFGHRCFTPVIRRNDKIMNFAEMTNPRRKDKRMERKARQKVRGTFPRQFSPSQGMCDVVRKAVLFTALFLVLGLPLDSYAYQVRAVPNGGTISGTVMFTGSPVPRDPIIHPTTNINYCGKTLPSLKYLIKNRRVQNVVVFIKNIQAGAPVPRVASLVDNLKCAFVPHVGIGFQGNQLIFKDSDPLFHNIHTYIENRTYYNVGLPFKGAQVTKILTRAGLIEITCDAHPWMRGWLYVFDNPYAALTNANGEFVIRDVPPGTYTVEAWHEEFGTVDLGNVRVTPGKTTTIKIDYKKAKRKSEF